MRVRATMVAAMLLGTASGGVRADVDQPTKFSNTGGITNTRHNLTQRPLGASSTTMNQFRNDYNEVCVYCHTPHAANSQLRAPLWNRTYKATTYTTYDTLGTSTLTAQVSQPGLNSLTCLSCHDGTVAIDSIINMPGSGGYSVLQETAQNNSFLNQWTNNPGPNASVHIGLNAVSPADGCLACHSPGAGIVGAGATDFRAFAIGTNLRDDHPVGIRLPAPRVGVDFNDPTVKRPGIAFYDLNANGRPDPGEIRFYDTGEGYEVECGSCHDPHGVSPSGPGGTINPTFLRISNNGSAVCRTCHNM